MKFIRIVLLCLLLGIISTAWSQNNPLEGTWKMIGADWSPTTQEFAACEVYKIYTKDHFGFVFFDPGTGNFRGAGGGTYEVNGNNFTEAIEYFSFDSTLVGSEQTFQLQLIGDSLFRQFGTLQSEKYDDYVLNEFYQRVEPGISQMRGESEAFGVWHVEEATYGENSSSKEDIVARYGKVIKIITPQYFYGVFFNPEKKYFNGVTFGKHKIKGDEYSETILSYSWDQTAVGQTVTFNWDIQAGRFHQHGFLNTEKYQNYRIEEWFRRIE